MTELCVREERSLVRWVVRITDAQGATLGTGFLVSADGLVVTCAHVVGRKEPCVAFPGGEPHPTQVVATDEAHDVAILRVAGQLPPGIAPARLGHSADAYHHDFWSRGYRPMGGLEGIPAEGRVLDAVSEAPGYPGVRYMPLILQTQHARGGMSGAPVYIPDLDLVVGMITDSWDSLKTGTFPFDQHTALATPSEAIHDLCQEEIALHLPEPLAEPSGGRNVSAEAVSESIINTGDFNVIYQFIVQHYPDLKDYAHNFTEDIEAATRGFVGRAFVFEAVEDFVRRHPCGYLRIIADAGLGKTAIAAEIARRYAALVYLNDVSQGFTRPDKCLNYLCAHLIARYNLPYDHLPERAGEDSSFLRTLLKEAAAKRPAGTPLLVVIDALDEADPVPPGHNWLHLPDRLPEGVYFVLTHRPGDYLLATDARTRVEPLTITWDHPRHQADIDAYLCRQAQRPEIRRALDGASPPISAERFVAALREASEGNFMYLDFVLEDIVQQEPGFDPLRLEALPRGLGEYYEKFWVHIEQVKGQEGREWERLYRPVIELLGVARGPVTVKWLAAHTGREADEIRERALLRWQRFLRRERRDERETWRIVHQSFANFLAEKIDLVAVHSRLADQYFRAWGGLEAGLPGLQDPDKRDIDGGYGLRHLAAHLGGAGRAADLHRLLMLEQAHEEKIPDIRRGFRGWLDRLLRKQRTHLRYWYENVWYTAKEAAGETDRYLADVERAWHLTRDNIGLQIRYALIGASLNSRAGGIPAGLLGLALDHNLRSPSQVLFDIGRMPRERQRTEALVAVAPYLKSEAAKARALQVARAIQDEERRVEALTGLAPYLPEQLQREALAEAHGIGDEWQRVLLLSGIVRCCAESESLMQEGLAVAHTIGDEYLRARALSELAPHLSEPLLREALAAVRAIGNRYSRARALVPWILDRSGDILELMMETQALVAPAMLCAKWQEWALEMTSQLRGIVRFTKPTILKFVAEAESEGYEWWLAQVVPVLSSPQSGLLLQEMLASLRTQSEGKRGNVLSWIAPHLPEPLLHNALEMVNEVQDEDNRLRALVGLLPYLSESLLTQAAAMVFATHNEDTRAFGLRVLGRVGLPGRLWGEVLRATESIIDNHHRAETLVGLAPHIPETFLEKALALVHRIDWIWRADALLRLIPRLPQPLQEQSLQEVLSIAYSDYYVEKLAGVVPRLSGLPENLLIESVRMAQGISNKGGRLQALASLIPCLRDPLRQSQLVKEAWADAMAVQDHEERALSRIRLVPGLPEPMRTDVLREELARAWELPAIDLYSRDSLGRSPRAEALGHLAPYLSKSLLRETLAAALVEDYMVRVDILAELAPHLPDSLLQEALAAAPKTWHDVLHAYRRTKLLLRLAELGHSDRALALVREIGDERERAQALGELAQHLPRRLMGEALAIAQGIKGEWQKAETLPEANKILREGARTDTLKPGTLIVGRAAGFPRAGKAWTNISQLDTFPPALDRIEILDEEARVEALVGLAPYLSGGLLKEALAMARGINCAGDRAEALAGLVPHLLEPLRGEMLREVRSIMRDIQRIEKKAKVLLRLAPAAEDILPEALSAIRELPDFGLLDRSPRAHALVDLAPHLSEPLLHEALALAREIGVGGAQVEALVALSSRLAEPLKGQVLQEALTVAREIPEDNRNSRAEPLAKLALCLARMPRTILDSLWRESLPILASRTRKDLLSSLRALSPVITTLGGEEAIAETFRAIQDVGRWWP